MILLFLHIREKVNYKTLATSVGGVCRRLFGLCLSFEEGGDRRLGRGRERRVLAWEVAKLK